MATQLSFHGSTTTVRPVNDSVSGFAARTSAMAMYGELSG
jgi:hypothetical protein